MVPSQRPFLGTGFGSLPLYSLVSFAVDKQPSIYTQGHHPNKHTTHHKTATWPEMSFFLTLCKLKTLASPYMPTLYLIYLGFRHGRLPLPKTRLHHGPRAMYTYKGPAQHSVKLRTCFRPWLQRLDIHHQCFKNTSCLRPPGHCVNVPMPLMLAHPVTRDLRPYLHHVVTVAMCMLTCPCSPFLATSQGVAPKYLSAHQQIH